MQYVEHPKPQITAPTDILLKVTATTVCGSDLHLYKGTFVGMRSGDIPGHEFLGIVGRFIFRPVKLILNF
jgi:threonine dehydrogenase-like Zn-dependent dehydrogenase